MTAGDLDAERAVAQARDELAVVHRAAAESRLSHAGAPAEIRDTSEQCAAAFQSASVVGMLGNLPVGRQPQPLQRNIMGCIPPCQIKDLSLQTGAAGYGTGALT